MQELEQRYRLIKERIAAAALRVGRDPAQVQLVAVSKTHPASMIAACRSLGQRVFGESYAQEALDKLDALADLDIEWHFIGRLQTNKAKFCVGRFSLIHGVDSVKLAQTLHKLAQAKNLQQRVLLQVNVGSEPQKSGVSLDQADELVEAVLALPNLSLDGLMCLPPFDLDPEATRPYFKGLSALKQRLETRCALPLTHLSMGMSGDFEQAVEEGATLVRVGSALFGERRPA
jgi:pyridoxal phosphate enzyme (YggS family)